MHLEFPSVKMSTISHFSLDCCPEDIQREVILSSSSFRYFQYLEDNSTISVSLNTLHSLQIVGNSHYDEDGN